MILRVASGRFELLRQVGEGGAGVVFEARDVQTNHAVAVKLLHDGNTLAQERFEQEIALLAELPHPAIVRYIAHGAADDGRQFLVMEWLAGKTADKHRVTAWPVSEVLTLARRVVSGLAFAAQRGISHRDIKPANLFLVNEDVGSAKILDFGLAQRTSDHQVLAQAGSVLGTPLYMSPEQARGDGALDARTDVFSLGSVLYALLCGRAAFLAPHEAQILEQICSEEPMPIEERAPHVPLRLRSLVQAMMRKDREERPDWRVIAGELSEIADQHVELDATQPINAEPSPLAKSLPPRSIAPGRRIRSADYRIMTVVYVGSLASVPIALESALREVAAQHGVQIDLLPGDARVLSPEQQLATGEQALLAARCALALQRLLSGQTAIAVCTGRVAFGDAEPFAELIERTSSSLSRASTSAVHVDAASAALLETRFELAGLELEGSGRTLERERSGAEAPRTLLGEASRFVGRERELDQLQRVFDDCVSRRGVRVLLITSPAGGGKTRLLQALLERLRASGAQFTLLSARGDPMHGGTQFGALSFALHAWAEIASGDNLELKRIKLMERVGALVPRSRAPLLAQFLGEMMGVPFPSAASPQLKAARLDPQIMADRMLEHWLDLCDALGERGPTVLCVEDLHWSDAASLRFIEAALRSSRGHALLVLALARPEVRETHPQLWAAHDPLELSLPKLDAAASAQLIERLSGAPIEPALRSALLERADGNPFFLEELVRGLATRPRDHGLPETILALVQARLADLGEQPRRLIQAASVFGQSFLLEAVRALIAHHEDDAEPFDFDAALEQLSQREIIVATGARRNPEYAFRHALLREAAYLLQPDEDRALGHCLAAAWLEQRSESPALIADHYERGGARADAGRWWARAAEHAFDVGSLEDALRFGARAIACGLQDADLDKLAVVLAEARSYLYDDNGASTWAERARENFPRGSAEWWRAMQVGANAQLRSGAPGLDALADQMIEQFTPDSPLPEQAIATMYTISESLRVMRDDVAERMLSLLPKQLPEALAGRPEGCLAAAHARKAFRVGNLSAALRFGREALDILRKAGAQRDVCDTLNLCGYLLHELGAYADAETLLFEATELGHRIGSANDVHYAQLNLGSCCVRQGRYDEAERTLMAAWEGYQKLAVVSFQAEALGHLAQVLCARGDLERARQTAERALQLESLDAAPNALVLARLAAIDLSAGLIADALAHASRAQELVREHGVSEFVGLIAVSHVTTLQAAGMHERAREALGDALRWLDEQAEKIDEPLLQRSFLEHVPEHAQLRRLRAHG